MNINLLPKKFIKNQAATYIVLASITLFVVLSLLLSFIFFFYQTQITKHTKTVQQTQMEKVQLEQQVKELSKTQSKDLQEVLKEMKSEQKIVSPIMTKFDEIAKNLNLTLVEYDITLVSVEDSLTVNGADESELLPTISVLVEGDFYKDIPRFQGQIEALEWVYDCQLNSIETDVEISSGEFIIRLKTEEVPKINRNGEGKDE